MIYPQRLGQVHVKILKSLKHDPSDETSVAKLLGAFIDNGLRAQARTGNLLTGQLYIALDFFPNAPQMAFDMRARPLVIPTVPGSLAQLEEKLLAMLDKLNRLPVKRIAGNLDENLVELRKGLVQFNSKTLPGVETTLLEVGKTLRSASATLDPESPQREQLAQTLDELNRMSRALRELSDYLGRHHEALLRGRPDSAAKIRP